MEHDRKNADDVVVDGMNAILRFAAKAGETIRDAGEVAVERLDVYQLERRRSRLCSNLGDLAWKALREGDSVSTSDPEVETLVRDISSICDEIARRQAKFS